MTGENPAMVQQQPAFVVGKAVAHKRKTHHQHVPGIGYVAHAGPPDLPPECQGRENCDPPRGTADGSLHNLKPPGGHPPMTLRWVAGERAWESLQPERGNRLAWPTSHLMKAGWAYLGATDTISLPASVVVVAPREPPPDEEDGEQ
jgi:hypothetical protein